VRRERWEATLRADGRLRVQRSRTPALVVLGLSGLLLALGGWLLGLEPDPVPVWVLRPFGGVIALVGLLGVAVFGFKSLVPGTVVTVDEDGVTPAGQPRIPWSDLHGMEIREEEGGLLVLRTADGFAERTRGDLGRLARFARRSDLRSFGPDRIRLRTATPHEARELADLLRWARKRVRRGGFDDGA
jgi:hypothetical protein